MAPLPEQNTARYFLDYESQGKRHTITLRYSPAATVPPDATFISNVGDWLNAISVWLPSDFEIFGHRYAAAGSTVTLPAAGSPPDVVGSATVKPALIPSFITFVGRSLAGRRARVSVLGVSANPAESGGTFSDYRVNRGDLAALASSLDELGGLGLVGIDGTGVSWYQYVNSGYNAHWQRAVRPT